MFVFIAQKPKIREYFGFLVFLENYFIAISSTSNTKSALAGIPEPGGGVAP